MVVLEIPFVLIAAVILFATGIIIAGAIFYNSYADDTENSRQIDTAVGSKMDIYA